jgi:hypothetical protein
MEWIRNADEWLRVPENRAIVFAVVFSSAVVLLLLGPLLSARYQEMGMSRQSRRMRNKSVSETIADKMTDSIEELVQSGDIEREDADAYYRKMHKLGYKGMGLEPTFGKPWFFRNQLPTAKVKGRIIIQMRRGGAAPKLP